MSNSEQPTPPTKEQVAALAELVKTAKSALEAAKQFADSNSMAFAFELGYHSFSYAGKGTREDSWDSSGEIRTSGQWVSSSDRC